jgi:hypothetical protein
MIDELISRAVLIRVHLCSSVVPGLLLRGGLTVRPGAAITVADPDYLLGGES